MKAKAVRKGSTHSLTSIRAMQAARTYLNLREAARKHCVSHEYVSLARKVIAHGNQQIIDEVDAGTLSLAHALKRVAPGSTRANSKSRPINIPARLHAQLKRAAAEANVSLKQLVVNCLSVLVRGRSG